MGEEIRQSCALDTQAGKSKFSYSWWLCTKARRLQKYNIPKMDQNRGLRQLPKLLWGKLQELHTCWQRRTERPKTTRRRCQPKPQKSHCRGDMFCAAPLLDHFGGWQSPTALIRDNAKQRAPPKYNMLSWQAILSKRNGETRWKQYLWSKTLWLKQKPNVNVSISIGSATSSKLRLNKLPNVNDLRLFGRSTPCSASLKRYPKVKCSRNGGSITCCKLWLKCSPKVKLRSFGRSTWCFWNIQR